MRHKKTALVLGSGGVRGFSYLGVLQVLQNAGIHFDIIVGSSIGSWIGGHYAVHQDIQMLHDTTIGYRKDILKSFFEPTLSGGIVKGNKVRLLLEQWLGADTKFEDIKTHLAVVSTDFETGDTVVHKRGLLVPAVQASMAIPTLFIPVCIKGRQLVDGGLSNPVPVDVAKKMGAEKIIVVTIDGMKPLNSIPLEQLSIFSLVDRSFNILQYHVARTAMVDADIVVAPPITDTEIMSWKKYFTQGKGEEYVEIGKKTALRALPMIRKVLDA